MATGPRGAEAMLLLAVAGIAALFVLWIAVRLAKRARRPKLRKPPRRTFEHGKRLALQRRPRTTAAAFVALERSPAGDLVAKSGDDRRADVVIRRKRNQPCEQTAGYLAGLFGSAWAHEVLVTHTNCAGSRGGDCAYTIQWTATLRVARTERASTPGSEDERRRSRRARPGGG